MTVVVGLDGSPGSFGAIRLAKQEASYRGVGLTAVMAYISDSTLGTPAARPIATPKALATEWAPRQAVAKALGSDDGVTLRVEAGVPGRVLVHTARQLHASLMVLATRKEHAPSRLLSAVSQDVPRNAPCPVLVTPEASGEP